MSEQIQNELNQYKAQFAQVSARLAATEQLINTTLKDLVDSKTNLNLYMQANHELNEEMKKLKESNKTLLDENAALKNPVPVVEDAA